MIDPEAPTNPDRAGEILADAVNLPPPDRGSFIRRKCAGDEALEGSVIGLLAQFERMGALLGARAGGLGSYSLSIGEVLDEQFRIVSHLGSGGMGEVYRAEDLQARDVVALKVIRPEWGSSESALERFRGELRQARRIAHPNICKLFHFRVGISQTRHLPVAFFTMEFLDGETLGENMRGRPLDVPRAFAIARGIANGLDAAHEQGIIHRDLKPGNVMLVRRDGVHEQPVITDFGLSKQLSASADGIKTGEAVIVGSPQYMAPEQFDRKAKLTKAVDVYALALILWEMLTGQRTIRSEEVIQILVERCSKDAPSLQSFLPGAPEHWNSVFARALARDPSARHGTASEFVGDFEISAVTAETAGHRTNTESVSQALVSRRVAVVSAASAILLSAGYGIFRLLGQRRMPGAPMIMLTPSRHDDNSQSLQYAGAADLWIRSELEQSRRIQVVTQKSQDAVVERMRAAGDPQVKVNLEDARIAREVALRSGANLVLFSNLTKTGDGYSLNTVLELLGQSPKTPLGRWAYTAGFVDGDSAARVASQVGLLARELRDQMRDVETSYDVHSRPAVELTTANWDSLQSYLAGERAWQESRRDDAVRLIGEATALDPRFALAWGRLADHEMARGHDDSAFEAYARATQEASRQNLSNPESFRIRGIFEWDREDYAKAARIYADFRTAYPRQPLGYFYGADCARISGDIGFSNSLLDKAIALAPNDPLFYVQRALYRLEDGDWNAADALLLEAGKRGTNSFAPLVASGIALSRGDAEGVERGLNRIGDDTERASYLACWAAEHGRFDDAVKLLEISIPEIAESSEERFGQTLLLGRVYLASGAREEAVTVFRKLADGSKGPQQLLQLAAEMGRAGDTGRSRDAEGRAMNLAGERSGYPIFRRLKAYVAGELALADGRAAEAFEVFKNAGTPQNANIWPARLFRAAVSAGRRDVAQRLLGAMVSNPGRWLVAAGNNEVGFMREALGAASGWIPVDSKAASLGRILGSAERKRG